MEYLRHFEGQKHVVFVTEKGLLWPSDENDRALAPLANDARVSIHTMQAGGLLAAPRRAKEMNATVAAGHVVQEPAGDVGPDRRPAGDLPRRGRRRSTGSTR